MLKWRDVINRSRLGLRLEWRSLCWLSQRDPPTVLNVLHEGGLCLEGGQSYVISNTIFPIS